MQKPILAALALALSSLPSFAQSVNKPYADTSVLITEDDFTDGFSDTLVNDVHAQELLTTSATGDVSPLNSHLKASATSVIDTALDNFLVGVSLSANTTTDSQPPADQSSRLDTFYQVHANAEMRDTLQIHTDQTVSDLMVEINFSFNGSPLQAHGNNVSLTAGVGFSGNSEPLASQHFAASDGHLPPGDNFFDGAGEKNFSVIINIGSLGDSQSYTLRMVVNTSLDGIVRKYSTGNASASFLDPNHTTIGLKFKNMVFLSYKTREEDKKRRPRFSVGSASGMHYYSSDAEFVKRHEKAPGPYAGVVAPQGSGNQVGSLKGNLSASAKATEATFPFALSLDGSRLAGTAYADDPGPMTFGKARTSTLTFKRKNLPDLVLSLNFVKTGDVYSITGTVVEQGGAARTWNIDTGHAIFTAKKNPTGPYVNLPDGLAGRYTVLFPPLSPTDQGLGADAFPQGTGWAMVTVATSGAVKLVGKLADGTPISSAGPLLEGQKWPFFVSLYGNKGGIGGVVNFPSPANGEFSAMDLRWTRPDHYPKATSTFYQNGWPSGIKVNLRGEEYVVPAASAHQSVFTGLGTPDPVMGNAQFTASGAGLNPAIAKLISVDSKNKVKVASPATDKLAVVINKVTGAVTGSFIHNVTTKKTTYSGVIDQKAGQAAGFFLSPTESGAVQIDSH
jgi:hypothetical protein